MYGPQTSELANALMADRHRQSARVVRGDVGAAGAAAAAAGAAAAVERL